MAVESVGSDVDQNNAGNITLSTPAGTQPGDIIMVQHSLRNTFITGSPQEFGWTNLTDGFEEVSNLRTYLWYRIAEAGDPSEWRFNKSSGTAIQTMILASFTNVDADDPFVEVVIDTPNARGLEVDIPSALSEAGGLLAGFISHFAGTMSPFNAPAGMTLLSTVGSVTVASGTAALADDPTDGSPTGVRTFMGTGVSSTGVGISISVTMREGDAPGNPLGIHDGNDFIFGTPKIWDGNEFITAVPRIFDGAVFIP